MATAGTVLLAHTIVYLHTSLRGKLRVWERVLDQADLTGNERLLDLGCGRGAVLIAAARRLPAGRAVGADLWTRDQSGNSPEATLANAAAIPSPEGRYRAVDEAMRVLRPGGQLLIADPWPMARKYAAHIGPLAAGSQALWPGQRLARKVRPRPAGGGYVRANGVPEEESA